MRVQKRFFLGLLAMIILAGMIPVSIAAEVARPVVLTDNSAETTTFTMPSRDVKVIANWTVKPDSNRIFYVAKGGSNTASGSSRNNPWGTIQYAIGQLKAGDTVIIREGTYNEKLQVNVSGTENSYITIKGEDGKRVILDGTGVSGGNMITLNNRSYVRIENLEICNNRVARTNIGISVSAANDSTGIQLLNNKIYNIDGESNNSGSNRNGHGIVVYGSGTSENGAVRKLLIEGNEIYNCKLGQSEAVVVNGNVVNWQISNNYIHDNDNIGIDAIGGEETCRTALYDRARRGIISGNVLVNNNGTNNPTYSGNGGADGIYVDGGKDVVIEKNYITGSAYGIEVGSENGSNFMPSGIIIRNNVVLGNDNAGILLGGTDGTLDALILSNTVYQTRGRCIEANAGLGPYVMKNNIIIATRSVSYVYVRSGIDTPTYTDNIYYGGAASRPSGDTNGQIISGLPVANLASGIVIPHANLEGGAYLTTATTPFLSRVI